MMATVRKEIVIDVSADQAWDAVRDWGALHRRLVPGFVVDTQLDGPDRLVTFFDGTIVRERLITCDDDARRLVWSIVDGPYAHHNGATHVLAEGEDRCRFVWTADLLPDTAAPRTDAFMTRGTETAKLTIEARGER